MGSQITEQLSVRSYMQGKEVKYTHVNHLNVPGRCVLLPVFSVKDCPASKDVRPESIVPRISTLTGPYRA
jgi:hypothetical protein